MFFAQKRGKLFGVPTGAHPLPWMGPDAPTTARKVGLLRGAVLSFEAKESTKESQRHGDYEDGPRRCAPWASACGSRTVGRPEFIRGVQFRPLGRNSLTTFRGQTALRGCPRPRLAALTRREKALYCPFLKEGVRNVARRLIGQLTHAIVRARAHSFPLSKRAGLFPFAAYRRSAPLQVGWGRS